ncbi:MAG: acyloxyacyl hydrolase, partial [Alphaproteobacteria bacterium]|nr:acyloxyacyl hydrolase [Alphaproteobacteria bacterium]
YTFIGFGAGFQAQQNERIGSKLIFGFKLGAGYHISECTSVEVFAHHFSNGNTAPENNSYAFYGLGITYSF